MPGYIITKFLKIKMKKSHDLIYLFYMENKLDALALYKRLLTETDQNFQLYHRL